MLPAGVRYGRWQDEQKSTLHCGSIPATMINMHPRQAMTMAPSEFPARDRVLANNLQSLSTKKFMSSPNKDGPGEGPVWTGSVWQPGQQNSRK
jgi:hypothetical protein